ncbi:MAG: endonuclease/exonuclease/phosphatase family protein [Verrucomicrobiota bacterium]
MNRRTLSLTLATLTAAFLVPSLTHAADPAPPSPPQPLQLRVLCFNLRYMNTQDKDERAWTARREVAGKVITDDKPDLIGYQEALRPMLDDLTAMVPGYEEIGVGRDDGKTKGEYSAIWVKKDRFTVQESGTFWLSDTPEIAGSKTWGNRVTRVCTWAKLLDKPSNTVFHFYNLHLDHESQEARDKGTAQVLKHMEARTPAGPFVLTGDFNSGEGSNVVKAIRSSHLAAVDSWRDLHPGVPAAESGTSHGFSGAHDKGKIDYIFVPKGTRLIDAEILHTRKDNIYPSDHFPVRATVEFVPK